MKETVCLHARRPEPFKVLRVITDKPDVQVDALPGNRAVVAYRIQQSITKVGQQTGSVSFLVRDGRGKDHKVSYRMNYYGSRAQ
jgi:hypothetical protein